MQPGLRIACSLLTGSALRLNLSFTNHVEGMVESSPFFRSKNKTPIDRKTNTACNWSMNYDADSP